ncbi:MAG: hypothetical protein ACJA01_001270 [Saprospiraceae bacterium]|jgi:hypothetical protein
MRWCLYLVTLMGIVACATQKKLKPLSPIPLEELLDGVQGQQKDYTFFSAKGRVKYNGDEFRIGGRCNILMIKDSLIWMNFKKLSIEGARVLITRDSFKIKYSYENCFEIGTLEEFLEDYNINFSFSELQDFIVGNVNVPEQENIQKFETGTHHLIDFSKDTKKYSYQINEDFSIYRILLLDELERLLHATFTNHDEAGFAESRELLINTAEEGEFKIGIDLSSVQFDVPKRIKFEIPSHYRKI